jgi:hypothetical protein
MAPEAARAVVDLRLVLGRQADHLGVAATLEVENAAVPLQRVKHDPPGEAGPDYRKDAFNSPQDVDSIGTG